MSSRIEGCSAPSRRNSSSRASIRAVRSSTRARLSTKFVCQGSGNASESSSSRPATPNRSDIGQARPNAMRIAWILFLRALRCRTRWSRKRARFRLHLVRHRSALKNRIHAILIAFGRACPMSDLFGVAGRELLDSLALPEPWQTNLVESLALVDDLTARIDALEVELKELGADHPSMRLLMTVPGVGWVLAYTIASKDRRHHPLRDAQEARRIHGPVPAGPPVRTEGPTWPTGEERPQVPALGADRSRDP